jgi:hypothetical protein
MNHWVAFAGIIAAQSACLVLVERLQRASSQDRRHEHKLWEALVAGLVGGLALGIVFDQLIGQELGFFQYYLQTPLFRIANAALSYGLAVATALQLSPRPISVDGKTATRGFAVLFLACVVGTASAAWLPNPYIRAAAVGAIVIAAGEALEFCAFRQAGPFVEAMSGCFRRALKNWFGAILVGSIYELANAAFPVWRWSFEGAPASFPTELTIVAFGYVVLLHASRVVGLVALGFIHLIERRTGTDH